MQPRHGLVFYEERLVCLWQRLVATLGIHTARVLLHRALRQTAQRHPDIALIHHDDCGLSFDALEMSYTTRPRQEVGGYAIGSQEDIEDALTDLSAEMVLLLTRLRGTEVAQPNETTTSPRRAAGRLWEPQEALLDLLSNRREARCDVSDAEHLEQASL